ncbi:hypothetical protein NCS56_01483700 [Fusarium sp. Ph1]|nr:hypothetical protein NCS56_01483700 [Fusarium sp. Ph1]
MFCRDCWYKIKKHRRKELGHYQTVPNDAIVVHSILKVRLDDCLLLNDAIKRSRAPRLRQIDDNSEWFGVRHNNEAGDWSLVESLAYDLLVDSFETPTSVTYPVLVSFVGATGSGKSTLINLLSKFSDPLSANHFKTPAVGDSGCLQSASSNVHLYVDPRTFRTRSPLLYAECEGMDGDEIPAEMKKPLAGALASNDPLPHASQIPEPGSQDIIWSKMPRHTGTWTRKEITRILFPKILYVFSDVVVFPFSRIRLDDAVFQLVKWGHNATIQSYNKPFLPNACIVFINRGDQVDPHEYDFSAARKWFFEQPCIQDISKDKALQPYIQYWETREHYIFSAEHLLRRYYFSKLYGRISEVCPEPQIRQDWVQWKWNAATLPLLVRKAFTHFASKYETSFNISDAWVDLQNFSPDFNWSIFNLARVVRGHRDLSHTGMDLWVSIGGFVASCLFLHCVRAKQADCRRSGCNATRP